MVVFSPKTLAFLRALKHHNEREWFKARKNEYEEHVRNPMLLLLEQLAKDFQRFAPDLVASPRVSLFRIYRDIRFSADKSPLKTQIGAYFPNQILMKKGAGLYLEIGPDGVWSGGGLYRATTSQLQFIRDHIACNHRKFKNIVESTKFKKTVGSLHGKKNSRIPRGFHNDHPAAPYLKFRQFLAGCAHPAEFAHTPQFYKSTITSFQAVTPLVRFLNESLLTHESDSLQETPRSYE